MATSRSFGEFARRLQIRGDEIVQNTERAVRAAAIAADRAIVLSTPVDTGRARANWIASVGAPEELITGQLDPSGADAMAQAQSVIERWQLGRGPIFLSNSLPYIQRLDDGYSQQAPTGMTRFGIDAARSVLQRARLLGD